MPIAFDTEGLAIEERFDRFQAALESQPLSVKQSRQLPTGFSARLAVTDFGALAVSRATQTISSAAEAYRSSRMIRRSDPEVYRLMVNLRGHNVMAQAGRGANLGVRDMAMFDSARPFTAERLPHAGSAHDFVMVTFPRAMLGVRADLIRAATSVGLSGSQPLGSLVYEFAVHLARDADRFEPADRARLSTNFLDLMGVWLEREFDPAARSAPRPSREVLFLQIQQFILSRLSDRGLSPGAIAAAHHISPRTLHGLFEAHGLTVAGWIRDRRLDACRRDLADPRLDGMTVATIGARWGFSDATHFSRLFHRATQLTPRAYRQSSRPDATG